MVRTLLLFAAVLPASADLLIRFGIDQRPDVDWSGSISPAPARLAGHQFDNRDSVNGASWRCTSRLERYWDTPYEPSMKGTSNRQKFTVKGIVVPSTSGTVNTAQGSFPLRPGTYLDGRVSITSIPTIENITSGKDFEDFPAALRAKDDTLWLAWINYDPAAGDRLLIRRGDAQPETIASAGDFFRVTLAQDGAGQIWAVWAAQESGNFDLFARRWDGSRWNAPERLTTAPEPDFYHATAVDTAGRLHLAWMSARAGNFDIYWKRHDGRRWSTEKLVSNSPASDWEPALAAAPDGSVAVLWDTYHRGNYDIALRTAGDTLGPVRLLTQSAAFEARVQAQYDPQGRLWLAWEEGDENWGKDYGQGIVENGRGLMVRRQSRVAVWANNRLLEPAAPLSNALPEEFRQAFLNPRLLLGGAGVPTVFFRYRFNLPQSGGGEFSNRGEWRLGASRLEGKAWSPLIEFPNTPGRIDAPLALAPAPQGVTALWTTDRRHWPNGRTGDQDLVSALVPTASAPPAELAAFRPTGDNLRPSHSREALDIARIRAYRAVINGKPHQIVRGDIHRHTDISWDGNRDGSLHDAYRYAVDAAGFEYMGVCDHQAGAMNPYNWWMIQKAVDLFSIPNRFAPLYSYERSLPYPNGHRNVLFAERGRPVLAISKAEQAGTEGAAKLYAYLRQFQGLTTSHTSATGAGTDWRDSSEDLEPVVEIYQGYRHSYEQPGAPRSPKQGEEPSRFAPGYVSNAWAKGIKMGVQSSSDHVSTHISYAALYVDRINRQSILDAIRARRTYAATDNIVVNWRAENHFMGASFDSPKAPVMRAHVLGTGNLALISVVKNNRVVYTAPGRGAEAKFQFTDREISKGTAWYYLRVEQQDGQIAWSSPLWITYP